VPSWFPWSRLQLQDWIHRLLLNPKTANAHTLAPKMETVWMESAIVFQDGHILIAV